MKKFMALIISVISVFAVFAFSACGGNSGISDGALEKIKNSQSDKVDLASWSKAMTSTAIYNSAAVVNIESKSTYASDSSTSVSTTTGTVEVYNNLTYKNGNVTGTEYVLAQTSTYGYDVDEQYYNNYNAEAYLVIDETSLTQYTGYGDEYYAVGVETEEEGYTVNDTAMDGIYVHMEYSGGEFYDCAYSDFTYDDELGSYVYEYTSGNYTYSYELKFSNGNLTYCKMYSYYCYNGTSYTSESTEAMECFYIYNGISVTVPSDIIDRIEALRKWIKIYKSF